MAAFLDVTFNGSAQATVGLTDGNRIEAIGLLSFGFLWQDTIWDFCDTTPVTGWTTCGAIAATGWTTC